MKPQAFLDIFLSTSVSLILYGIELIIILLLFPWLTCDRLNYNLIFSKQIIALTILFTTCGIVIYKIRKNWYSEEFKYWARSSFVVSVFVFFIGLFFLYGSISEKMNSSLEFERETWNEDYKSRTPMTRYLYNNDLLIGKKKTELIKMLGDEHQKKENELTYSLTDTYSRVRLVFNENQECIHVEFDCYD